MRRLPFALAAAVLLLAANGGPGAAQTVRTQATIGAVLIKAPCFTVTASVVRVIDADTFVVAAPIWHGLVATETVRLLGVNAPEVTGPSAAAGLAAKAFAAEWLGAGPVTLITCKRDAFGRSLARVQT